MQAFLSLPDSFGTEGGLDAAMAKCAVLSQATPTGLAEYAVTGTRQNALVEQLLGDPLLMRDMLVAGGAVSSEQDKGSDTSGKKFGQAMEIWAELLKVSDNLSANSTARDAFWDDRSQANILRRVALGTAVGHAVPIGLKYTDPECDQAYDWCPTAAPASNVTTIDPVARYRHYEAAYRAGDLDPALEVMTAFECRHAMNSHASHEDLQWLRESMAVYRPDHIAMDYHWRYAEAVRTEVAYGDPQCANMPGVCDGHYAEIPASDGVCGPRAFFGRFTRLAWGLPTWGATQPGHAAMTTWSPDEGWHVLLGASWPSCWWGDRAGPDFFLEAQARESRADFQKILRGSWVAEALGEPPVGMNWDKEGSHSGYGQGGPWGALMLYAKKISVAKTPVAPRAVGPSLVPTKAAALIAKWPTKQPTPTVIYGSDGTITIPAAAFTSKNRSASMTTMPSMGPGEQLLHNGCASSVGPPCLNPGSSSFEYTVKVADARTYYLTANFTTWHMSQDLLLSVNGDAKTQVVPVFYTVGWWNQTQPIAVDLIKGDNTLSFTRYSTRELVFKEFASRKRLPWSQSRLQTTRPCRARRAHRRDSTLRCPPPPRASSKESHPSQRPIAAALALPSGLNQLAIALARTFQAALCLRRASMPETATITPTRPQRVPRPVPWKGALCSRCAFATSRTATTTRLRRCTLPCPLNHAVRSLHERVFD